MCARLPPPLPFFTSDPPNAMSGGSGVCRGGCRRLFRFSTVSIERGGVVRFERCVLDPHNAWGGVGTAHGPKRIRECIFASCSLPCAHPGLPRCHLFEGRGACQRTWTPRGRRRGVPAAGWVACGGERTLFFVWGLAGSPFGSASEGASRAPCALKLYLPAGWDLGNPLARWCAAAMPYRRAAAAPHPRPAVQWFTHSLSISF